MYRIPTNVQVVELSLTIFLHLRKFHACSQSINILNKSIACRQPLVTCLFLNYDLTRKLTSQQMFIYQKIYLICKCVFMYIIINGVGKDVGASVNPVSILYKSIAGRYQPAKVANGPIRPAIDLYRMLAKKILYSNRSIRFCCCCTLK